MPTLSFPNEPRFCGNLIAGQWQTRSAAATVQQVKSPYNNRVIGEVAMSTAADVTRAATTANEAFQKWRLVPIKERCKILFRFRELLIAHIDELANLAAVEAGKMFGEAKAGIEKGLEVVEFALSLQNLDSGAAMDVSRGVSCEYRREPLGVVAGVVPFNFPAMVPMWMFPIAITLGNCFIMKPSEKVPLTLNRIGALILEAGYPAGVFSLVNGGKDTVNALIDAPQVKAVAFVGSTAVAKQVYIRASSNGKRCLALGGAKNYLIMVPDADEAVTVKGVVDSFTGCAGQRCMAASLMVAVGDVDHLITKIADHARGIELGKTMGAIIDKPAYERISQAIAKAEADGAKILLDGRKSTPPRDFAEGNWMGPTIIDQAKPDMECAKAEIFGPVLTIVRKKSLPEALCMEHGNTYGNATSIFTTSGAAAKYVSENASSGMVGINIGVPVPREPFSFGGTKESKFGHGDITGESSLDFWTNLKKVTTKWGVQSDATWMS